MSVCWTLTLCQRLYYTSVLTVSQYEFGTLLRPLRLQPLNYLQKEGGNLAPLLDVEIPG